MKTRFDFSRIKLRKKYLTDFGRLPDGKQDLLIEYRVVFRKIHIVSYKQMGW
jgi:hypothetical protein